MADRYLKHTPTGHVFIYAPPWIGHDDFVECANPAGDPLPDPEAAVSPAPRAKRSSKVAETPPDDAALSADASRGLAAQGL